jgi:nucleotide-binding universal stress UspA family protein
VALLHRLLTIVLDNADVSYWRSRDLGYVLLLAQAAASIAEERSRDAAFTVVDYAERQKVEQIVIGASGKNTVKRFLLGSVSNDVVRKAHCPVTIVH